MQLNLKDAAAVRDAYQRIERTVRERAGDGHFLGVTVQPMVKLDGYEVILGCSLDVQLGPVLLFGWGGQLVEVIKDRALALPPLNTTLARRMMEQTKIYEALKGVRGRAPANLDALEKLLVRFSQLVVEQPLDQGDRHQPVAGCILALRGREGNIIALDARVVLHGLEPAARSPGAGDSAVSGEIRRAAHAARWHAAADSPDPAGRRAGMVEFHKTLSEQSVYLRYFHSICPERTHRARPAGAHLFNDYDRELALVAVKHFARLAA